MIVADCPIWKAAADLHQLESRAVQSWRLAAITARLP
jgi:hypothetical protein